MRRIWHFITLSHKWEPRGDFETRYYEGWPLWGENLHCECGAKRWDITREAVRRNLDERIRELGGPRCLG